MDLTHSLAEKLIPERIKAESAWIEHVPFAFHLVERLRPDTIVELGTHTGVSYCAFCQAVEELKLRTRCYAVDLWEGDAHAGSYGNEVLDELQDYHDPRYGEFSKLLQMSFSQAVEQFEDGSIDLLHIDGLHTYEAVKLDFDTWRPKLSPRAVVLFHDTNEYQEGFGVWKFWAQIRQQFPSFSFGHGHGLGVALVGQEVGEDVAEMVPEEISLQQFFLSKGSELLPETPDIKKMLQDLLNEITSRDAQIQDRADRLQAGKERITKLSQTLLAQKARIAELESEWTYRLLKPFRKLSRSIEKRFSKS